MRFAFIGGSAAVVFALVTIAMIRFFRMDPSSASMVGYCASVPTGFIGHRHVSFRSRDAWAPQALRFALVQAFNFSLTVLSMHTAVARTGGNYYVGIVAASIMVPTVNFILSFAWVFRERQGSADWNAGRG